MPHSVFLRLSLEGALDRFFKAAGFSREFQTGEEQFDRRIYIACDHPAIETLLQESREVRAAILDLLRNDDASIHADGEYLWVRRPGDTLPSAMEVQHLATIRAGFAEIPSDSFRLLRDSFFWRALLVQSIAWSLAFYGLPAVIEMIVRWEPLYFDWGPVIRLGLLAAAGLFAGLAFLAWLILRGSSRAHRVFVESLVVLTIGVPLSSIEMVSDANILLDHSAAQEISVMVDSKYTTTSRGRRGRRTTHYHLRLNPAVDAAVKIPNEFTVSSAVYSQAARGSHLTIAVREGAFHFPWVEQIRVGNRFPTR